MFRGQQGTTAAGVLRKKGGKGLDHVEHCRLGRVLVFYCSYDADEETEVLVDLIPCLEPSLGGTRVSQCLLTPAS